MSQRDQKSDALDKFVKKEIAVAQEKRMSKIARLKAQRLAKEAATPELPKSRES
jgi:hypothetical protein